MAVLVPYKKKSTYFAYFLKNTWFVLLWKLFRRKKKVLRFAGQKGITQEYSNKVLKDAIKSGLPFAAIRFGGTELSCLNNYEKIQFGWRHSYKKSVKFSMKNNGGFFPTTDANLNYYASHYFKDLPNTDILGISGIHMEDYFYQKYIPHARVIQYNAFEPLMGDWTSQLAGKRVLVISPFAKLIEKQYAKRREIISNETVLPDFTLLTVEAVQTLGDQLDERFLNWFEALDYLKMEIVKHEFDIALVGAGAFGTPLCWFIKSLNRQAIQTGGATQLLFGIMGRRWENRSHVTRFVTSSWTRPEQLPKGAEHVEKGCYW
ncbi:MAG TPA: hypothetical protein DCX17_01205 [Firmicutes bacterium]|jgi:hypothetical protein|nr:hypothetical protein [Bacillota bacterium]